MKPRSRIQRIRFASLVFLFVGRALPASAACVLIGGMMTSAVKANMFYYETYVIFDTGSGNTYYDLGASTAAPNWQGASLSYNLLGSSPFAIKGAEFKAYRDDGSNYWNTNNTQTLNYSVYAAGGTPSFSAYQLLAGGSGGTTTFLGGNDFKALNTSANINLGTSITTSGAFKIAMYVSGNASYDSGGQQYFSMAPASNGGSNYVADVSAYYGATSAGTQPGAFTGTGRFEKSGAGTYVLNQANSYTGGTSITGGTVQLSGSGTLGSGANVNISSGANLDLNGVSVVVASVRETGVNNGGTISLGSGTLTINGADKGTLFQNSISGTGGITMAGSGTTSLGLYGTQDYTGTTTVSGGKISSGVNLGTLAVVVSGGEFEMTADNKLADSATLSISSGTLDLQGTDTVASLTSTGGSITLGSGKTLTVTADSSIGAGSTVTGGTLRASGGTLAFNSVSGNSSAVTIESSAKLTGTGTIGGATTINASGTLAPTPQASGSKMTINSTVSFASNSIFEWDLNAGTSDPGANTPNSGTYGQLAATGTASGTSVFTIVLGTNTYADAFWNTDKSWNNVFSASGLSSLNTLFTTFAGAGLTATGSGATAIATAAGEGHFSFSGTTLNWTAVPEPASTLAGLLLGAGLLRRRRG